MLGHLTITIVQADCEQTQGEDKLFGTRSHPDGRCKVGRSQPS